MLHQMRHSHAKLSMAFQLCNMAATTVTDPEWWHNSIFESTHSREAAMKHHNRRRRRRRHGQVLYHLTYAWKILRRIKIKILGSEPGRGCAATMCQPTAVMCPQQAPSLGGHDRRERPLPTTTMMMLWWPLLLGYSNARVHRDGTWSFFFFVTLRSFTYRVAAAESV